MHTVILARDAAAVVGATLDRVLRDGNNRERNDAVVDEQAIARLRERGDVGARVQTHTHIHTHTQTNQQTTLAGHLRSCAARA